MKTLSRAVKEEAIRLGFTHCGIAPGSTVSARQDALLRWIQSGFAGNLAYMERFMERQTSLRKRLPDLKNVIVLAVSYAEGSQEPASSRQGSGRPAGRVARYARGRDYHRAIQKRLKQLELFIRARVGNEARFIRSVDTHPVQERVLAEAAGLGFFGKNTCLIRPKGGSYFFLAALLTNLDLTPDDPISWDCGACTLCIESCPTKALRHPYQLDASRCVSNLTIELRGEIPPEFRPAMKDLIFGCDICQEVCPYNRRSSDSGGPQPAQAGQGRLSSLWPEFQPEAGAGAWLPLQEILEIRTEEEFLRRFAGTPLMRAKRAGLLRNAAVAAGNSADPALIPALQKTVQEDPSDTVRQHAAWALEQFGNPEAGPSDPSRP